MDQAQRQRQQYAARDAIRAVLLNCPPQGSTMTAGEHRRVMQALCALINWGWAEDSDELTISLKEYTLLAQPSDASHPPLVGREQR